MAISLGARISVAATLLMAHADAEGDCTWHVKWNVGRDARTWDNGFFAVFDERDKPVRKFYRKVWVQKTKKRVANLELFAKKPTGKYVTQADWTLQSGGRFGWNWARFFGPYAIEVPLETGYAIKWFLYDTRTDKETSGSLKVDCQASTRFKIRRNLQHAIQESEADARGRVAQNFNSIDNQVDEVEEVPRCRWNVREFFRRNLRPRNKKNHLYRIYSPDGAWNSEYSWIRKGDNWEPLYKGHPEDQTVVLPNGASIEFDLEDTRVVKKKVQCKATVIDFDVSSFEQV